jgi:hypothetical protein
MLNRSASSILVCCRSIVSTLLADVLCAVRGALCGWFASIAINEALSPGHGEQKLALAAEMAEEKTSRNSSDRGKWYDDWKKSLQKRGIATLYNGQQKQMHAASAVRYMPSQQVQAQDWDCNDVNIGGVDDVTESSTAGVVWLQHIG